MNEYLRRPERVQAMRWTWESTVELSRWLDARRIGHHFHDAEGDTVATDSGCVVTMCLNATAGRDEIAPGFWIVYSQETEKATVHTDPEFRRRFQVTL